ncbi:DUF1616 domain-containing protein [Dictyobacter formicarum]|uniref:DUF1616 domain-containing protein n=1 Tax=Dictyobacter formicarum TaxID=2778368 RepID=A0ABQ3V7K2_9CHLR|nr:DUF1616 domain-containing protein [Dictyobacter formicarum]GHO82107.1 hypothetical protein KSZ_01130 [Dictyobacter formicarum]
MRLKNLDVLLLLLVVVANVFHVWLGRPVAVIGGVLALPLVFVCPGYVLAELVFKKRLLDIFQRLLLSIGGSLALDILGGMLLNILPGGLNSQSWMLLLCLITVLGSGALVYARHDQASADYPRLHMSALCAHLFCGVLVLVMMVMIMRYDIHGMATPARPAFTQFWLLPARQANRNCAVTLGIQNFERTPASYRIVVNANNNLVAGWSLIRLAPQQTWQHIIPLPQMKENTILLEAFLYQTNQPERVYRHVAIHVHVTGDGPVSHPQQCAF